MITSFYMGKIKINSKLGNCLEQKHKMQTIRILITTHVEYGKAFH